MALDTAIKRKAALGLSTIMLPSAASTIDRDSRSILLRLFLLPAPATIIGKLCAVITMKIPGVTFSMEDCT